MIAGAVKFFNAVMAYGFVAPEAGGNDTFVGLSAIKRAGTRTLEKGQRATSELEANRQGQGLAVNLQLA